MTEFKINLLVITRSCQFAKFHVIIIQQAFVSSFHSLLQLDYCILVD